MASAEHRIRLLPQLTSLNQIVFDLFRLYQPAFAVKRLGTGLDLDPELPPTWADLPQLKLGLGNLLSNAVKHTRHGGLIVCRTAVDGDWLRLTLGDNGPGVSAELASALFAPWHDGAAAPHRGRSALGLHMSRAIIAAHGGEIGLDTSHDTGAWFVVRLPAIAVENARLVEELERANRHQSELLATLSYELRTPLQVILGYTDLVLEGAFGALNAEQTDTMRRIDRSARELVDLVNSAIDLRCVGAERMPIELSDPRLPELLRRFCQLTTEVLACDFTHLFLCQRSAGGYAVLAGHGDAPEEWEWVRSLCVPALNVARLLAGRDREEPAVVAEPQQWLPGRTAPRYAAGRCLVMAVQRNGETLGILVAGNRHGSRDFSPDQARLAQGIADLAAMALENARLVDELERTKQLRKEFAASMSHESRIPLNVIIGYADLLLDGEFGPLTVEQSGVLQRVRSSSLDLLDAINRNLDLSDDSNG